MAFEVATATNYWDFFKRWRQFLTGQAWTEERVVRGPAYLTSSPGMTGGVTSLFDDNPDATAYFANSSASDGRIAWLHVEPVIISRFEVSYGEYSEISSTHRHDKLRLEGSQDGSNWTELARFDDVQDPTPYERNTTRNYVVAGNTTAYAWHRLVLPSPNPGVRSYWGIGKLRLYDETDTSLFDAESPNWVFRAPGVSAQDKAVIQVRHSLNPYTDLWNFGVQVAQDHVNDTLVNPSGMVYTALWNQQIPYWLVANNFRIAFAARVDTIYAASYAGAYLPYCKPSQHPAPYLVGGDSASTTQWKSTSAHQAYTYSSSARMKLCRTDNTWTTFNSFSGSTYHYMWPYRQSWWDNLRDTPITNHTVFPIIPCQSNPKHVYGELYGVRAVPGYNNASENILTIDGKQHVCFQNVWDTARQKYWALELD